MKKIVLTGGGTLGHVSVNLALIDELADLWNIDYIGSEKSIEQERVSTINNVNYHSISTGKLRRYRSMDNFIDIFRIFKGIMNSFFILRKLKPDIIFSKGGYVSFPVVVGGWLNRILIITHESDLTPGLANKLSLPFTSKICTTFPETEEYINHKNIEFIGPIVRKSILNGDKIKGLSLCDFNKDKPVLLVIGGSLGAENINNNIRKNIIELLNYFQIVHICGKNQIDNSLVIKGYKQFEYLNEELSDVFAISDIVISRAGSNSIFEFLALNKPMLLIPLSKKASRGDQILNAKYFEDKGFCEVVQDEELSNIEIVKMVNNIHVNRRDYINNMKEFNSENSLDKIIEIIND